MKCDGKWCVAGLAASEAGHFCCHLLDDLTTRLRSASNRHSTSQCLLLWVNCLVQWQIWFAKPPFLPTHMMCKNSTRSNFLGMMLSDFSVLQHWALLKSKVTRTHFIIWFITAGQLWWAEMIASLCIMIRMSSLQCCTILPTPRLSGKQCWKLKVNW